MEGKGGLSDGWTEARDGVVKVGKGGKHDECGEEEESRHSQRTFPLHSAKIISLLGGGLLAPIRPRLHPLIAERPRRAPLEAVCASLPLTSTPPPSRSPAETLSSNAFLPAASAALQPDRAWE